ncbi:methylated-DNA--[protein]-cysteine S-methyltransferase [Pelagicoccus sp. NFK12]|uniref:methylated-DNA--[protein]-cysteine S-methyltransferase n=1 Tax=Pelagicoccus enzymogenes TaxID=2773457 RepID=A0A927IIX3_9BACT|nr:methylated-DNA--[protein]-cysteine S-methyltransferase [Pelagicoccus enzymogenes]MBD5780945.1 methylated-DNA--[protein]-cysteine S-methyltransferase [Pelagicoccus enzymogenes]MDQ8201164.1 methylated-DNA--[protein]-cysteine S-methyltransferase [Pelagicoccus enzymogenes]
MSDYERIAKMIRYLDQFQGEQPSLQDLASFMGMSPHHLHRLFSSWASITPKDFLQCLTAAKARELLREGRSVLDTSLEVGLSGPGRLHDLCVKLEGATPGEIKSGGAEWEIRVGFADTPFGEACVAESPRGICHLSFLEGGDREVAWEKIRGEWPAAALAKDDERAAELLAGVFSGEPGKGLRALVRGTDFQVRVWQALIQVPAGSLVSYGQLAAAIGKPEASRAVGTAVGRNELAFLIPCHRVIRETGVIGNYRWGRDRKRAIIAWENGMRERSHASC